MVSVLRWMYLAMVPLAIAMSVALAWEGGVIHEISAGIWGLIAVVFSAVWLLEGDKP